MGVLFAGAHGVENQMTRDLRATLGLKGSFTYTMDKPLLGQDVGLREVSQNPSVS